MYSLLSDVGGLAYGEQMNLNLSEESLALIALLQEEGARWATVRASLESGASPSALLREQLHSMLVSDEFDAAIGAALIQVQDWQRQGLIVSTLFEDSYPRQLLTVHDFPPVLFARGQFREDDYSSVAIVGTREPSEGALRFIDELTNHLAEANVPIVSGLARGVDTAAIKGSLRSANRTIGVIGTGLNKYYPKENVALQDELAHDHLVISQFWPDAPPTRQSFPMRNHVMSAFASVTVIVEASEKSGTRIQARAAVKHGRPLVLTRAVVTATKWGRDLVSEGRDVRVVSNAAEALRAVQDAQRASFEVRPVTPLGVFA